MRRAILSFVLMMLLITAIPAAAQPPEVNVPVPTGWTVVDQEYRYGRDNLWEYINGAAELFLTYGFRELIVADFEQGEASISVSVYDMSRPLDAFGVFESEKPSSAETLEGVGSAAVLQAPYQGLLLKDRFYVKIEAGGGDISAESLRGALQDVAAGLPGDDGLPAQLAALPEDGRMLGSVAFAGGNFLGFDDLKACLYADYKTGEDLEYRLFVMKPGAAFLRNKAGKWTQSEQDGRMLITRKVPYRGVVVLMGDPKEMIGVSGFQSVAAATKLLESLLK